MNVINKILVVLISLFIFSSCSPKISKSISKNYPVLDYREEVAVLWPDDPVPENAEKLGSVKIGDSGFTVDCDLETVLDKAKMTAREVGGNMIKITKHKKPNAWGSTCHRIVATILRVDYKAES